MPVDWEAIAREARSSQRLAEIMREIHQGGQGESPGPSFLVPESEPEYSQLRPVSDEAGPPIDVSGWQVAYSNWREETGRPANTGEMNFRLGGGTWQRPMVRTMAELAEQFPMSGPSRQATNIGGIMKVSVKGPELTVGEKRQLKEGYRSILQRGFGQLPLDRKLTLYINDVAHMVRTDNGYWTVSGRELYVGTRENRGEGDLSSVGARLAVTAALMGLTGHASDAELLVEFEKALAKMLAGQFEEAVRPLGVAGDDRPVGKMAWSATGVAAWVDGGWCSPVTGEPVEVGQGWTVIDTNEGPVEVTPTSSGSEPAPQQVVQAGSVAETASEPTGRSRSQEDWERRAENWGNARYIDGRLGINTTGEEHFQQLQAHSFPGFDLEYVTPHPTSSGSHRGLTVVRRSEPALL